MRTSEAKARKAEENIASLLNNALPGSKRSGREHVSRAKMIAKWIYNRFGVYPNGWQQKHLIWVRDEMVSGYAARTRYHYYRAAVKAAHALGRPQIVPGGAWSTPDGSGERAGQGGRPARLPPSRRAGDRLAAAHGDAVAALDALRVQAQADGDEDAQQRADAALAALRGEDQPSETRSAVEYSA